MRLPFLAVVLASAAPLLCQEPQAIDKADLAPAAPAAGTPAAQELLEHACSRMLDLPSGRYTSDEEQDLAMLRGQPVPGGDGPRVRGGWDRECVWGDNDGDAFVVRGGRMVVETKDGWKLRGSTLASGVDARTVVNVEADTLKDRPVAILSLRLEGDTARDFCLSGVLPQVTGGMFLGGGGMLGMAPAKTYSVDLALSVDLQTLDVLRLRAKVYEENPMLANVRIQFGPGGEDEDEPADAADAAAEASDAAPAYKKGLPDRRPGRTESVVYFRVDFRDLGAAEAPEVDENGARWLGR